MALTQADMRKIETAADAVKPGDLYRALKDVGDDPVKAEIENVLKEVLSPFTFRTVVAVFKLCTED